MVKQNFVIFKKEEIGDYLEIYDLHYQDSLYLLNEDNLILRINIKAIDDLIILIKAITKEVVIDIFTKLNSLYSMQRAILDEENQEKIDKLLKKEYESFLDKLSAYYNKPNKVGLLNKKNQQHIKIKRILRRYLEVKEKLEENNKDIIEFNNQFLSLDATLNHTKDKIVNLFKNICEEFLNSYSLNDLLTFCTNCDDCFVNENAFYDKVAINTNNYQNFLSNRTSDSINNTAKIIYKEKKHKDKHKKRRKVIAKKTVVSSRQDDQIRKSIKKPSRKLLLSFEKGEK